MLRSGSRCAAPVLAATVWCGLLAALHATATSPPLLAVAVTRALVGAGMHRSLHVSVHLQGGEASAQPFPASCRLLITQPLPAGIYADSDELATRNRAAAPLEALVTSRPPGQTGERPAHESRPSAVDVLFPSAQFERNLDVTTRGEAAVATVPLHARYPQPTPGAAPSFVDLPQPTALLRCAGAEGGVRSDEDFPVTVTDGHVGAPVVWRVPSGDANKAWMVAAVTSSSSWVGAVLVLAVLFVLPRHKNATRERTHR